jgi:glycosyltransferase involved in cell wall biosynthesis
MADILVLSYEDFFYEVSGVLHRVALFGKPLICSNIPRFNSCLTDGKDAMFFTPRNHVELASCIRILINDALLRERLSRELVKKFSDKKWKLIAREHEQLFLRLVNNSIGKQTGVT